MDVKKFSKWKKGNKCFLIFGVIILLTIGSFLVYNSLFNEKSSNNKIKLIQIDDLSTLLLKISDFPPGENWTIKDKAERGRTDVSEEGLNLGWKRGYMASYIRGNLALDNQDYSRVDFYVSEYPLDNITKAFSLNYTDNFTIYDPLSDPKIGDESKAYKIITTDEFGVKSIYYQIEFRKGNFYDTLQIYGTRTDYSLLKELAQKAEAMI
jgi:hypothetical protein